MPVAEGFRTWVRCPPPPPMQPGRTALLGLDEIEDLEGGLGPGNTGFPTSGATGTSRAGPSTCPSTSADLVGSASSTESIRSVAPSKTPALMFRRPGGQGAGRPPSARPT